MPAPSSIFSLLNPEIFVITTAHKGQWSGQVATWVSLGSLIPDQMRVVTVLSPRNFTVPLLQQQGQFVLNLLAADQAEWLSLFGLYSTAEVDKFVDIDCNTTASGLPILPDTCGWAECQIIETLDWGDRLLVIADVVAHEVDSTRQPLCRREALTALPPEVTESLAAKRLMDIEADRALRSSVSQ